MNALDWINDELEHLTDAHRRRARVECRLLDAVTIEVEGRRYLNFASNDYLNLASDQRLTAAAREALESAGCGSAASPLITGRRSAHRELEELLAAFEDTEAALLFPTGYAANVGAITSLVGAGDVVFSDAKNHASIIDGCRLSRADVRIYRHADTEHLAGLLANVAPLARRLLIVTDGLFSMDGDIAPLGELAALAEEYGAMLMVDEAHATGVFGEHGRGAGEALGIERIDVRVGTLSKALGSVGGFVAGSRVLIELLVNRARSYIFSTSPPAAVCAAGCAALQIVQEEPWRRRELLSRSARLRDTLTAQGWNIGPSTSQIVPLVIGEERMALDLAAELRLAGFWVPAIRPPSVAPGESRLRLALSYAHSDEMIAELVAVLHGFVADVADRAAKL